MNPSTITLNTNGGAKTIAFNSITGNCDHIAEALAAGRSETKMTQREENCLRRNPETGLPFFTVTVRNINVSVTGMLLQAGDSAVATVQASTENCARAIIARMCFGGCIYTNINPIFNDEYEGTITLCDETFGQMAISSIPKSN